MPNNLLAGEKETRLSPGFRTCRLDLALSTMIGEWQEQATAKRSVVARDPQRPWETIIAPRALSPGAEKAPHDALEDGSDGLIDG
jgi:hypothetical protein